MGICVWQHADTVASTAPSTSTSAATPSAPVNQTVVKATSEERRASGAKRLAQLRSSLGTDAPAQTNNPSSASDAQQPADTPAPDTRPLSAEQQQRFARLIEDIQQAASDYSTAAQTISVMHGDTLKVSRDSVVLPGGPEALTPQLKQQLWHALAALA